MHNHDDEHASDLPPPRPPSELREIMKDAVEHKCFIGANGSILPLGGLFQTIGDMVKDVAQNVGHFGHLTKRAGLVGKITGLAEAAHIPVSAEQRAQMTGMDCEALTAVLHTLRTSGAFAPDKAGEVRAAAAPVPSAAAPVPPDSSPQDLEQTQRAVLIAQIVGFCDAADIEFPQERRLALQDASISSLMGIYAALKVQRSWPVAPSE